MLANTEKEQICINGLIGQKTDIITVEQDVIVNDIKPDILNCINTNGTVCVYKREVLDGKIKLDGCVNVCIMYLADDENGSIRSLNTCLDFSKVIDFEKCEQGMMLDEYISLKNIECKVINGRKVNIKAFMQLDAKLYSNENIDIIKSVNDIDDIQMLNDNISFNSLVGMGETKAIAKDTITIDNVDDLAEILKIDINIINKDIKISYNKVLAKADMLIKIMYLTEDNRINCVEEKLPVMGFIDIQNISDTNICDMRYKLCNLIVKPNSTEEHSLYIEAEFEIVCFAYENRELNIIQDLYSPTQDMHFTQKTINTICKKEKIKEICNIKEEISMPEVEDGKIYDVEVVPDIQNIEVKNERISYSGEIELKILYCSNMDNNIKTKEVKLPFNFTINNNQISDNTDIETNIEIANQNFVILQGGYISINISLEFEVSISKNQRVNIVDEVNLEECRQNNAHSLVIYFVKPGDTLWKIAKAFRSTVEDIATINQIEDVDKINVGMQLFIPRYTRKITA